MCPGSSLAYLLAPSNGRRQSSRTYGRAFDLHAVRPRHQIKLELDEFRRAVIIGLGACADLGVAHPPRQRAERLPLQPIQRIAGRLRLRNSRSSEVLVPIIV